jgi:hypothetical protein
MENGGNDMENYIWSVAQLREKFAAIGPINESGIVG